MGNWLNDLGVNLKYKGKWDAASGDFPTGAKMGDWWISENSGTMLSITPSQSLSVNANDHFMFSGTEFVIVSSSGRKFSYFDGVSIASPYLPDVGEYVYVNTAAGSLTLQLPTSPNLFDQIDIISVAPFYETNNLTIDPQGNDIGGVNDSFILNENGLSVTVVWLGGSIGWAAFERGDSILNNTVADSGVAHYVDVTDAGGIGHKHVSYITDAEARDLIDGTVPSVLKTSSFVAGHDHVLTYTYNNGRFSVAVATNHVGQEHVAIVLGYEQLEIQWILVDDAGSPPAPFPALPNDHIIADTFYESITIQLPAAPALNSKVVIIPARPTYSTNPLYIDNNGAAIGGTVDSIEVNIDGMPLVFIWKGGSLGWIVAEGLGSVYIVQ